MMEVELLLQLDFLTSPVSTQTTADDSVEKRVTTVGRVHPHLELKVVDPQTGAICPAVSPASSARGSRT